MSAQRGFQMHAVTWAAVNAFLFLVWLLTSAGGFPWFLFPAGGWGIALAIHAVAAFGNPGGDGDELVPGRANRPLPPAEDPSKYRTLGQ